MTRPSSGARFVCTSKIDKKIPIRRVPVFKNGLSSTSDISVTVPSAAATIAFGSAGTSRSGSRKNKIVPTMSATNGAVSQPLMSQLPSASNARIATIQRASEMVWRRIGQRNFQGAKSGGQGGKKQRDRGNRSSHNIVGLGECAASISSANNLLGATRLLVVFCPPFATFCRCLPERPDRKSTRL